MAKRQAYSYRRVSGTGQAKAEKDGLPRQQRVIAKYAKDSKIDVVADYCDGGVTGTTGDRPALTKMLADLAGDGIKLVVLERADRLGRDLLVSEMLLAQFRKLGVEVRGADGTDLTAGQGNPSAVLVRQMLSAVSEYDKSSLVAKLRAARDKVRKETGRCEGAKPYGEKPGEQATLARILELYRKPRGLPRLSYAKIAKALNDEGHKPRQGKMWYPMTVSNIVKRTKGQA